MAQDADPGDAVGECAVDSDCAAKEDGNACNGTLRCAMQSGVGSCILDPSTVVTCNPSGDSVCAKAACIPATGQCALQATAEGAACDDGNTCTSDDACVAGSCVGTALPANACDDGDACTADELCLVGICGGGFAIGCDDGNACTSDNCDAAKGCVYELVATGGACGGLAFDGIDDCVVMGNLTPAAMPNLTFEAWVYRTADAGNYQTIFGDDDGGYDRGLVVKQGKVYVWAGVELDTGMTSTLNTWEHFAVVSTTCK